MNSSNITRRFHTSATRDGEINGNDLLVHTNLEGDVLVIGGANVDRTYRVTEDKVQVSFRNK